MRKPTSVADLTPIRVVIATMDSNLSSATLRAAERLKNELPGLTLSMHAADEWSTDSAALQRCQDEIARADIILATMLFMEDHFKPILESLRARRENCDAIVCAMSAGEVTRMTRMGRFSMDGKKSGPLALLKRLRGSSKGTPTAGADQMKMLRRIPKMLRFIPGTAQDVRSYFLVLQYWLAGSEDNLVNMVRFLVRRYASGTRISLQSTEKVAEPLAYPEVGLYHPRLRSRFAAHVDELPTAGDRGTVGLLLLRSYLLSGNTAHYDGVIHALEAKGLKVVPAFASGLDARPAMEQFFTCNGVTQIDVLLSLTGFSMVGGPAYNDSKAAEQIMASLDVPYLSAHPVEFQTVEQWQSSDQGLLPVEATIMVAIPELDGATSPMIFGGRSDSNGSAKDMSGHRERAVMLAARVAKLVALRRSERADRKIGIVLFNFPPNAGNVGSAAFLAVFESLHNTLRALKEQGYTVDAPATVDDLRERIVVGNSARFGAQANVHKRIPASDHVKRERHLKEIEAQWGAAPGKQLSDGASIFVLGERFGNIFVGLQPAFGYEGDPMRLLFEKGHAPTHAFSAFYRYLREDFAAHALLHFGTHGALEFMPGKQVGMSQECWPDRLIQEMPNFYLYCSSNPSEGTIAKRRIGATLISYLTPPVTKAGLYRGLADLKQSIERWRSSAENDAQRQTLCCLIHAQAAALELAPAEPEWSADAQAKIEHLQEAVLELEYTLIPHGMHVVGQAATPQQRAECLAAMMAPDQRNDSGAAQRVAAAALVDGETPEQALARAGIDATPETVKEMHEIARADELMTEEHELEGIVRALDGCYIRPAPGGDLLRTREVLPTGRNLHGFDPFRIPSAHAVIQGAQQAEYLIERHMECGHAFPESIALVLWGTDNLKTEGGPIAQALALIGARPRFDSYGRIAGATLLTLAELGRPRIDVIVTLSGIFRDLLPLQIKLLAEASYLASSADEPENQNFVRKHTLAYQRDLGCDFEQAALRVYGNAESSYGSNVNHMIENSRWDAQDELAEVYTRRKCFAYSREGRATQQPELLKCVLAKVDLSYQNLDSVELGVTTVDTYFDTLGGINSAVQRAKGGQATPVYIADHTQGSGAIRTLAEQVSLETRTRTLNPKWFEGMLAHGYEGVRQIEVHVTNTMGWSATTGAVQPWVYQHLTETFILDPAMRERLAKLNPTASTKAANRLLEASERKFWHPDENMLAALRAAGEELEDRLEGVAA